MKKTQVILLPSAGFRDGSLRDIAERLTGGAPAAFGSAVSATASSVVGTSLGSIDVVRQIGEDGPKLVEIEASSLQAFRRLRGLRAAAVRQYRPALRPAMRVSSRGLFQAAQQTGRLEVLVRDAATGAGIGDAEVLVTFDPAGTQGVRGRTGRDGVLRLRIPMAPFTMQRLIAVAPTAHWSRVITAPRAPGQVIAVDLDPIDLTKPDWLRSLYPSIGPTTGRGVSVAVVDTGVDENHPDLVVRLGKNMTTDGQAADAITSDHGTHVAGIIAGQGRVMRGLAPGAAIHSYRVFALGARTAKNFDIAAAIDEAVTDGCDLINLSLGGGAPDQTISEAIAEAFRRGVACIAAVGNDGQSSVSYPAVFKRAVGVSALGNPSWVPPDSVEGMFDVDGPAANPQSGDALTAFSNFGSEVDFAAPGLAVISTVRGGYAAMSGTSMACPAVTALTAGYLSRNPVVLGMARDAERASAIIGLARQAARSVGLPPIYEGFGRPT